MKIYTVSELTCAVKDRLESDFPELWVEGELSNLRVSQAGHCYFTLKDARSQLKTVMFRNAVRALRFGLEEGLHLLACGRLSVYEARGEYQLVAEQLEPKGLGEMQLAFEQLKRRLEAEGLFRAERKRRLPFLPQRIGIVTSPGGAVLHDMLQILERRFPNLEILIAPAAVQGESACREIVSALEALNGEPLDLVILARGGGSLEDLRAFNEEAVARAIVASRWPVISAVGHETDVTIADLAADLRAPTPSAAAELAVPVKAALLEELLGRERRLEKAARRWLETARLHLRYRISRLRDPRKRVEEQLLRLDALRERMRRSAAALLERSRELIRRQLAQLKALNPLAVLERGFALATLPSGKILKRARDVSPGATVQVRLAEGGIESRVVRRIDSVRTLSYGSGPRQSNGKR